MVEQHPRIPPTILAKLRQICLDLPEAYEEPAWVGVRWRIRKKTFAHVLMIADGWPEAYAKAAGTDGPACVLTFRSFLPEIDAQAFRTPPFFKPVWWPDIAGMIIQNGVDWEELTALLATSYRLLAPKKLAKLV